VHTNNTAPCDDHDACTTGDHCSNGQCVSGSSECGGQGCSPGYWKQCDLADPKGKNQQHCHAWADTESIPPHAAGPYSPLDLFNSVFGVNAFPGKTLLAVLQQGGGGLNALGRHAVGALLNAASPGVNYELSPQQVIDKFKEAFNDPSKIDEVSALFESLEDENGRICPLN
jgi:hypothetical protein